MRSPVEPIRGPAAPVSSGKSQRISVIVPIYNEQENINLLLDALFRVLRDPPYDFEIVAVNDGSTDGSYEKLSIAAAEHAELKVINLRRNFGQTAAIMAGIDYSSGNTLIFIDADLQNDPEDIPLLLAKLDEGYDVVSGWRRNRQDAPIRRNFMSRVANSLISWSSGVHLRDYGCTLKAYRIDVIRDVRLYGEMHRFIPIYATWMGARVAEIAVRHHARRFGRSKYGLERTMKVLLDLIVIKFLDRYFSKPIYVFGGFRHLFAVAFGRNQFGHDFLEIRGNFNDPDTSAVTCRNDVFDRHHQHPDGALGRDDRSDVFRITAAGGILRSGTP